MSIDSIRPITKDGATCVVPPLSDYTSASPDWTEVEYQCFRTAGGSFGGCWEGESGEVSFDRWPYGEACVLLSGRIALVDTSGNRREFGAGEAFYIPVGFSGRWITLEPTKKIFVAIRG